MGSPLRVEKRLKLDTPLAPWVEAREQAGGVEVKGKSFFSLGNLRKSNKWRRFGGE